MEFGVRWERNLSIFQSLRAIYEPLNHNRKIIGFDIFGGFKSVSNKDGKNEIIFNEALNVTDNYDLYLQNLLRDFEYQYHVSKLQKFEIVKINVEKYLKEHPETIIFFAYFDIYEPTKVALEAIISHLSNGSIICFDELNCSINPEETLAFKEVFGLNNFKIRRSPYSHIYSSNIIYE